MRCNYCEKNFPGLCYLFHHKRTVHNIDISCKQKTACNICYRETPSKKERTLSDTDLSKESMGVAKKFRGAGDSDGLKPEEKQEFVCPPRISEKLTFEIFKQFAGECEISDDVLKTIMLKCDDFWKFSVKKWEAYAEHAGRNHLEKSDLQLGMLRIDRIKDYNEFRALALMHLDSSDVYEVLEPARAADVC